MHNLYSQHISHAQGYLSIFFTYNKDILYSVRMLNITVISNAITHNNVNMRQKKGFLNQYVACHLMKIRHYIKIRMFVFIFPLRYKIFVLRRERQSKFILKYF